jgi:hypothetical protein
MTSRLTISFGFLLLIILINNTSGAPQDNYRSYPDSIDILILEEANHLWNVYKNEVWQNYNLDDIPILLFYSSDQHCLLEHPNPPDNFKKLTIYDQIIYLKNPEDEPLWYYFSATIWPFNKHWTAILPSHLAWRNFCKEHNLPVSFFPPDQLVFISLHERFHIFQMKWLEDDYKNIFGVSDFNSPPEEKHDVLTNIPDNTPLASFCIREQATLYKAYREKDPQKAKQYITEFLNLRDEKYKFMSEQEKKIEDYMELVEGTAKYIELMLSELLQKNYQSIKAIRKCPQFNDYKDVIISQNLFIEKAKTGDLTVNRVNITGTIMCRLLDRFRRNKWKKHIFENYHEKKVTLCNLLTEQSSNIESKIQNEKDKLARKHIPFED